MALDYKVSGYATTFDMEYILYNIEGIDYYEVIAPGAIDARTEKSSCVFLLNHEGIALARQENGSMVLTSDNHGLKVVADLGLTQDARRAYESINAGMLYQMSFAFKVDDEEYNSVRHTRTIKHISNIYDCSAVNIPANPYTNISSVKDAERSRKEAQKRYIRFLFDKIGTGKRDLKSMTDSELQARKQYLEGILKKTGRKEVRSMENKLIYTEDIETPERSAFKREAFSGAGDAEYSKVINQIPVGMDKAVKIRKLAKDTGVSEKKISEIIAIARSKGRAIVEKNGLVWEARSERDVMDIFDSEKGKIIYR